MKKFLAACVLTAVSTASFANEVTISKDEQVQKLTQQISHARYFGTGLRNTYNQNPNYFAKTAHWKIDTQEKNQCLLTNLSESSYSKMIYPTVVEFAKTQTSSQLQSYIDLMDNGLADGLHNLMTLFQQTQRDFLTGKITAEQRERFIQTSPLITIKQRLAINKIATDSKYENFDNFLTLGNISSTSSDNNYKSGSEFGEGESKQFIQYISTTCHLN